MKKIIKNENELLKYINALDQDEGIKIVYEKNKIIINKYNFYYNIIIKNDDMIVKKFSETKDLINFLLKIINLPIIIELF